MMTNPTARPHENPEHLVRNARGITPRECSVDAQSLVQAFEAEGPNMLDTIRTLVNLDTPSDDPAAVARALDVVEAQVKAMGAACSRLGAGDIIQADLEGAGSAKVLLLCHCDTVFGHGEAARRPLRVEGSRAFGPGVADMKGGLALALYVAKVLRMAGSPFGILRILVTGDEESGAERSRHAIAEAARDVEAALVMEPGRPGGEIVSARKGVGHFVLHARGQAAHAGIDPDNGHSAVMEITRRIVAVGDLNGRIPGVTFNVGVVRGGTRANVVAGEACCEIDVRVERARDVASALALLRERALAAQDRGVRLELTGGFSIPPMEKGAGTNWLLRHASEAAKALGIVLRDVTTGGASDGNRLAQAGIPVLDGLGPVGGRLHSPDEYIELPSLPTRGALVASIVARIDAAKAG